MTELVEVYHKQCGYTIMLLKSRPVMGEPLNVADIAWPDNVTNTTKLACWFCERWINAAEMTVHGGLSRNT